MRKKICSILLVAMLLLVGTVSFASGTWGNLSTVDLAWNDGWTNTDIRSNKSTNESEFDVYATAKTMSSAPRVRLVNSAGAIRSDPVSIPRALRVYTGSNNTGVPGFTYWAQVIPAWNQVGTDSIRFQIRAR